jgi:hypothetical protein
MEIAFRTGQGVRTIVDVRFSGVSARRGSTVYKWINSVENFSLSYIIIITPRTCTMSKVSSCVVVDSLLYCQIAQWAHRGMCSIPTCMKSYFETYLSKNTCNTFPTHIWKRLGQNCICKWINCAGKFCSLPRYHSHNLLTRLLSF